VEARVGLLQQVEQEMTEIVFGPPGCGKTTTLLNMVEKELSDGTPPDRIAFVTFTTKGANEAIERACKRFKLKKEQLPYFRTLHSLCYRSLGLRSANVLAGAAFNEFAEYARIEVTGRAWSDDGLLASFKRGDRILFMENLARIRQVPLREQYNADPDGLPWNEVTRVATALASFKASKGLMDYTDMLTEFVHHDRDVGVKKLFVDEAQDLSSLQWSVVELLARSCDRVVVAGDDDQAIYRWAGADVEHLIAMEGTASVLGRSYRCPPVIQKLADKIIGGVAQRRPKKWAAKAGGAGVIEKRRAFGDVELSPDGSVLVLARNAYVIREQIEPALRRAGVLYERNGVSSIKPAIIQAVFAWEDLRKGEAITLAEARRMYAYIAPLTGVKRGFKTLKHYGEDEDVPVSLGDLIQTGGLLQDPNLPWHDALDRLPQEDMSYILAARRRGEKVRGGKPRVRLSTIHSAKGGEADHVVLMKEMAARTHQEMALRPDDERRVFYVGVTRTRERLSVVSGETSRECPWL
jgi:DNA helicase-2/ATP-dependent DNA helicase PcrA